MDRSKALFWSLVGPEHLRARAFCRKLMNNREEVDGLYQDSLVSTLTRFENLREAKLFRAWLYRIIINGHTSRDGTAPTMPATAWLPVFTSIA